MAEISESDMRLVIENASQLGKLRGELSDLRAALIAKDEEIAGLQVQLEVNRYCYLTCIHDRHSDDKFKAFSTEQAAKYYLREMQIKYRWTEVQENMQYGDWCLFITDDYYMSVEKIELA